MDFVAALHTKQHNGFLLREAATWDIFSFGGGFTTAHMRYLALATDYDGTLATDGQVAAETVRALDELIEHILTSDPATVESAVSRGSNPAALFPNGSAA